MVLCSGVRNTVLRISESSDVLSDSSDLISTINGSRLLVAEMRSEPSNAHTMLCTSLISTNLKFYFRTLCFLSTELYSFLESFYITCTLDSLSLIMQSHVKSQN
ncbi:hypothetical protein RHMOL_Rhmol03G0091300 [Rhododendron molle]|uniref:Uncharacterized protein n=1 Tax=Rhododendron molle TaxID=49168 RepID=A0ACC0PDE8_RHOML|nr:hypothetical protein RHMOL_Rhmol03G0091300 [Rhododendron molle]